MASDNALPRTSSRVLLLLKGWLPPTPQVVVDRMFIRMITCAALPVIAGLLLLVVFYYLKVGALLHSRPGAGDPEIMGGPCTSLPCMHSPHACMQCVDV
jgi:hypothetical protein